MLQSQPVMHDLPAQQNAMLAPGKVNPQPRTWSWIPPVFSGTQVEGTGLLPFGRYQMPDGSETVSFGLPQVALGLMRGDLHKAADEYQLGERGPQALPGKAFDAAGAVAVGSAFQRAPTGALRSGLAGIREAESAFNDAVAAVNRTGADFNKIKHKHELAPSVKQYPGASEALIAARAAERRLMEAKTSYLPNSDEYQNFLKEQLPPPEMLPRQYHGTPAANEVIASGRFRPSTGTHDFGEGVYTTDNAGTASSYAVAYGSEGRIGKTNATPGVIPLDVRGRFIDGDGFSNVSQFEGYRLPDDAVYAGLRRAGYDGVTRGGETVIFPEAKGRGVVRNAMTGATMFANPFTGAIVPALALSGE